VTCTERSFGEIHFGDAKLGNEARTKRLVRVADALTRHPGGTLPQKLKDPAALQALYRLLKRPEVTHASLLAAHQAEILRRIQEHPGPLLAISDATELDYSGLDSLTALGQIGNGSGRGYICQNVLIVDPQTRQAIGLGNQILHTRAKAPPGESRKEGRERASRESRLWPNATQPLPRDAKLVVVCDCGADTFEELEHEALSGRRFAIRVWQDRRVLLGHEEDGVEGHLHEVARQAPRVGSYEVEVSAQADRVERIATVQFAYVAARLLPPEDPRGEHSDQPLPVWIVHARESDPPAGAEPLEWFILTNEPIANAAQARTVLSWYECRWVVEEFHKAQKTGCDIEDMQFTYQARLEAMIALQSVVALTLLNLRDISRRPEAKSTPAATVVAAEYVEVLSTWRHGEACPEWTVHDFFLALARLGGHQNRRRDKPPGWIVLWRGWTSLQLLAAGFRLERKRRKPD
jgi:hypothetical protein